MKISKAKLANTAAYYLSIFVLGLFTAVSGPALPTLADNTGSTLDQISFLFVIGGFGYLLGSYLGGRGFDRLPGHRLIAASLLMISLAAVFIPITHFLWLLLVIQLLMSMMQAVTDVGSNTLLLWTHGKEAGPYLNGLHFFFGIGSFIAPLVLAALLGQSGDIRWAYWAFAIICIPLAIWIFRLPEPERQVEEENTAQTRPQFFLVAMLVIAFLMYVGGEIGFGNWIYTYALTLGLSTEVTAAVLTSAFWGTFTAGRLLAVWISTRVRPATIVYVDLIGSAAAMVVILLWPNSTTALWAGTIGLGLFMASMFPTMLVLAGERMQINGEITGWFLFGGGAGSMILPWIIGQAFTAVGAGAMPWVILASVGFNLLAIVLFNARTAAPNEATA